MEHRTCFMFGHSDTSYEIMPYLEDAVERFYLQHGIQIFVVGNRGSFDRMAATAVKNLKKKYCNITLQLLLAYHPAEHPVFLPDGFDSSFYPPLEGVPRRYAIVRANRYMIAHADGIVCYVCHVGNARELLTFARRRGVKPMENVAETQRNGCKNQENIL